MKPFLLLLLLCFTPISPTPTKDYYEQLSDAALLITKDKVEYDGSYFKIKYPNGDVPANVGVCTDVVIRSYRKVGADLQQLVHQDMAANFAKYPKAWGLKSTDTNIDHRRVPNLQVFFTRKGQSLPVTNNATDYKPGDIVTWMLPSNHPHIGVVVNKKGAGGRFKMVHNIGYGQNLDDCLFEYKITGHYRYKK
ncbi:DUF1287 domain-containing protein [Flavobacterium subsaxonicum]|uniref:DUF1287 domain-containing protein n=1 Tax=Flavobacterium subsaxonicum WB 4.1-42 = DSM 21790 TaxID=1121898 RepID=A0A0A2MYI2_9FLAO|nr:DUF1287 domain-containing protein [Flavobacterium subsaxonicum]KGO93275.1 hypothetical protein Q766_08195 [Flavobacterium subsaxonicum WB 4.1-42 = DSM 21790]